MSKEGEVNFINVFAPMLLLFLVQVAPLQRSAAQTRESEDILRYMFSNGSELLVGSIVAYDADLNSHSSQGDLVLRVNSDRKFIRLRYGPSFGFDAPPATKKQLIPKEFFGDNSRVWSLRAHTPRGHDEIGACTGVRKAYAPAEGGGFVEIERYVPVPGKETYKTPRPESLPCMILESWEKKEIRE